MVDILWNIFELTVTVFEEFVIIHFICKFLNFDFSTFKGKLVYISGSIGGAVVVTILDLFSDYSGWLGIIYVVYWFVFSLLFVKGTIWNKLFSVIIANMVLICTSSLVSSSVTALLDSEMAIVYSKPGLVRFLAVIMVQITNVYLFSLILKFVDKSILSMKKSEWILVIAVFLISFFSLVMTHMAFYNSNVSVMTSALVLLSELGIVLLNLICLYMTLSLSKSNKAAEELRLREQQREYSIQYAEAIQKQYDEIRNMRHDMKQHFAVISRLQKEGNSQGVIDYTNECAKGIESLDMFVDVKNNFVNAILNSKLSIAKSKGVKVLCSASNDISGINDYDLCNLLGNMLDNAIEASESVVSGKFLDVSIVADEYMLNICVSNSISKSVLSNNKALKTSKNNSSSHGLGIKTIRSIAEKYNGSVDFYEEGLIFFCRTVLFK